MSRSRKPVLVYLLSVIATLALSSDIEARCRLFGRRQRQCCPQQIPMCGTFGDTRCARYYSGLIGDVYMHYGTTSTAPCTANSGPVYLSQPYCMDPSTCACS